MSGRRPKRRVNHQGRSEPLVKYVAIHHWVSRSEAWKHLRPHERTLFVELYGFFNGRNNGEIFLSCREAAKRCNMSKDRANQAFHRLRELGFIKYTSEDLGPLSERNAQCWILTEFPYNGREATKDFLRWQPPAKQKTRPKNWTRCPETGTPEATVESRSREVSRIKDGNCGFGRDDRPSIGTQLSSHIDAMTTDVLH